MQLLPSSISIIEIVVVVALAAIAITGLVLVIQLRGRLTSLESTFNDERRRMAEIHAFLERISRTNTTQPDMDMGLGAVPYAGQPMGAMGPQSMTPDYGAFGPMSADASRRVAQSMPFQGGPQGAFDPQAMCMPDQRQAAQQHALEYAKYQERMQAHADQMQHQAMMPMQTGGRPQRQTQPVPPR